MVQGEDIAWSTMLPAVKRESDIQSGLNISSQAEASSSMLVSAPPSQYSSHGSVAVAATGVQPNAFTYPTADLVHSPPRSQTHRRHQTLQPYYYGHHRLATAPKPSEKPNPPTSCSNGGILSAHDASILVSLKSLS